MIVGIDVLLIVAGRLVIAPELCEVVAFEGFGELVEELDELGGRLIGEIDRQTDKRQIVGLEHGGQRGLRAAALRSFAF
jgi:hypothetical protein